MPQSHAFPAHRLRSGLVLRSVVGASLLAAAGLSYLYLKHQLYVAGLRKRGLETELRELTQRGRVLDAQIAELTSRTTLQVRLKDGFIHMVEIPSAAVVRVPLLPDGAHAGLAAAGNGGEVASSADEGRALRFVASRDPAPSRTANTARQ